MGKTTRQVGQSFRTGNEKEKIKDKTRADWSSSQHSERGDDKRSKKQQDSRSAENGDEEERAEEDRPTDRAVLGELRDDR